MADHAVDAPIVGAACGGERHGGTTPQPPVAGDCRRRGAPPVEQARQAGVGIAGVEQQPGGQHRRRDERHRGEHPAELMGDDTQRGGVAPGPAKVLRNRDGDHPNLSTQRPPQLGVHAAAAVVAVVGRGTDPLFRRELLASGAYRPGKLLPFVGGQHRVSRHVGPG